MLRFSLHIFNAILLCLWPAPVTGERLYTKNLFDVDASCTGIAAGGLNQYFQDMDRILDKATQVIGVLLNTENVHETTTSSRLRIAHNAIGLAKSELYPNVPKIPLHPQEKAKINALQGNVMLL